MTPALHHRLLIAVMQSITTGDVESARREFPLVKWPDVVKKVIILEPPGSAKSTYTSVLWPPWHLANKPQDLFLSCSYSYSLIEGFGRQCRDIIAAESKALGYGLSKTAAAAGDWRINVSGRNAGGYFCGGVGSGITGRRASVGCIDDYCGTQEDADSKLHRDNVWRWYWSDFVPRLLPNAPQLIMANRRHEDDLVGRILELEAAKWLVIKLPMLAEENDPLGRNVGERLWPEWFTEEMVQQARLMPRVWSCLYQQRPSPEEGNFFKRDWFTPYTPTDLLAVEKAGLRYYVGADYAVGKKEENDRTCFLPVGVDSSNRIWVLPDWFWTRANSFEAVEATIEMAKRRKPIAWFLGREVITKAIGPFLQKRMQETGTYVALDELSEAHDKQVKAQAIRGRAAQRGQIMVPAYAPGWDEAEAELLMFPGGQHDDFVDALAKVGQGLAKMTSASLPKEITPEGLLPCPRVTLGWIKQSHRRRERLAHVEDN